MTLDMFLEKENTKPSFPDETLICYLSSDVIENTETNLSAKKIHSMEKKFSDINSRRQLKVEDEETRTIVNRSKECIENERDLRLDFEKEELGCSTVGEDAEHKTVNKTTERISQFGKNAQESELTKAGKETKCNLQQPDNSKIEYSEEKGQIYVPSQTSLDENLIFNEVNNTEKSDNDSNIQNDHQTEPNKNADVICRRTIVKNIDTSPSVKKVHVSGKTFDDINSRRQLKLKKRKRKGIFH